jgi:uncharacterized protein (TIGR02270 family)
MEFLRDILEEHLEEAIFLYTQRRTALADDGHNLADLARLEERLLAHVDGLVVAGGEAWDLVARLLTDGDEGEAFIAALVTLAAGDPDRSEQQRTELLAAFKQASGETLAGLTGAFCLFGSGDLTKVLRNEAAEAGVETTVAVLEILAFHRQGFSPDELRDVLRSEESTIRIAGLRAAASMGWRDFAGRTADFLTAPDPNLVAESIRTGFILNDDKGLQTSRALVAEGKEPGAGVQIWLGLAGRPEDATLLAAGLDSETLGRGAVTALGWLGQPGAVDKLLQRLDRLDLARRIGAAVRRITGVDLAAAGLVIPDREEPAARRSGNDRPDLDPVSVTDDDLAELAEDPDDFLPWPDPHKLTAWWQRNRGSFQSGHRYRYGREFDRAAVLELLRTGGLAERHLAACELARMSPGQVLLETRHLTWHQSRLQPKAD